MQCHVRPARAEDAVAISRVALAALHESNALDYPPDVIAEVARNFAPEVVSAQLSKRRVFVALLDETVIGTAALEGGVVRSVFVEPTHQKRGIGRHLMQVIHATAAHAGIEAVRVPSSITAENFYIALGYRRVRDAFHGAERTIVMEKRL